MYSSPGPVILEVLVNHNSISNSVQARMPNKARVLIVGGGGVGTISAYNLEQGGLAIVTMVLRSNFTAVVEKGFTIDSCNHGCVAGWRPAGGVLPQVSEQEQAKLPFDYIVCCTKNIPDVSPTLVDVIRPAISARHTVVVLIQNGLDIEKPLLEAFPENTILSGVSLCGAEEILPGHILHKDPDRLLVGAFPNPNVPEETQAKHTQHFFEMYNASGKVETHLNQDVLFCRWRKLLFNAVYNPICALTDIDSSRLRLSSVYGPQQGSSIISGLIQPAMEEIRQAALAASGVVLGYDLIDTMIESEPIDAFIMPSMQQDARRHRYLECEVIMGAAVRAGESAGVDMPVVKALYHLCKAIQFREKEARGMVDLTSLIDVYNKRAA